MGKNSNDENFLWGPIANYCREKGLVLAWQGSVAFVKHDTGKALDTVMTIPDAAKRLKTNPVPQALVSYLESREAQAQTTSQPTLTQ